MAIIAVAIFYTFALALGAMFVVHQVLHPARNTESVDLGVMMGHPSSFTFYAGTTQLDGWFFPGLRTGPTVLICHGYDQQRASVLTLMTALQDQHYNVFVFDFAGQGNNPENTTLGYRETEELRGAIDSLAVRPDIDPRRFAIWGNDMGGYAALKAAEADSRIVAVAVDSAYDDPATLLQSEATKTGLTSIPFLTDATDFAFHLSTYSYRQEPPVSDRLGRLQGIPKLFIESQDRPVLQIATSKLFQAAPPPRRREVDRVSYGEMGDEERKNYENMVVSFFVQNLPALARTGGGAPENAPPGSTPPASSAPAAKPK